MPSTGPHYATLAFRYPDQSGWEDSDSAFAADGNLAIVAVGPGVSLVSGTCRLNGFGLNVPCDAQDIGIVVELAAKRDGEAMERLGVTLSLNTDEGPSGVISDEITTPELSDTLTTHTLGSPQEDWRANLTPELVNDPNFGIDVRAAHYDPGAAAIATVSMDFARVWAHWN